MTISWKSETVKLTDAILEFTTKVDKLMLGSASHSRGIELACLLVELRSKAHDSEVLLRGPLAAAERLLEDFKKIASRKITEKI